MPAVRAYMVIAAAADLGTVVASAPEEDDVEAFDGRRVDAVGRRRGRGRRAERRADLRARRRDRRGRRGRPRPASSRAEPRRSAVAPRRGRASAATPRAPPPPCASTPSAWTSSCTSWASSSCSAPRSRSSPPRPRCPGLSQAMQDLTRCSHALQAIVMQVRMIPVEAVFLRFPRLVRDLSSKLGKQVELELVGQDTELDRTVVDALGDPLVHLVRNALDHGLETPAEREAAGKPRRRHGADLGPPRRRQRRHHGGRRRPRRRSARASPPRRCAPG